MEVNDKNFDILFSKYNKYVILIDFWASWCRPCKLLSPIIDYIEKKYKKQLYVFKINIDNNTLLSEKFNIQSIPTLIFFLNGIEKERHIGSISKENLEKKIKNYFFNKK
ncbi:thioredoxin [Candidatus Shikimatogenerans silvanidophilus]|uniref:thioredoxin n=1 Tax=Candidatus Shikimatogenerans silvanidophilus TaxID=2782547 RepID=UPI001BACAE65|nr:thioredoxin [Candidatus Shikimatogenerans silvanidophilus]